MKLHDFSPAPNGLRVRIFMAEKGLNVPTVEVAVRDEVMFKEPYLSMNPFAVVPFLAVAAAAPPAKPDPTTMMRYFLLLAGLTNLEEKRWLSHFSAKGPSGIFASRFI